MNRNDVNQLFALLLAFYPHATNAGGEQTRKAWYMALKDYTYEELKEATLCYAAKEKYFPQLSELMDYLPARKKSYAWMKPYLTQPDEPGSISRYAREHGMTWQEAKEEMRHLGLTN